MVEQSRETLAAHRGGEPVATKLLRIEFCQSPNDYLGSRVR